MARYTQEHKGATRQRIIEAAGHRMKRDGIDGSGVAILMKDAGLTNGAFYSHFASKDDLVKATIGEQLRAQRSQLAMLTQGSSGIEQFVRVYLSRDHRDNPGEGCPSAALLGEIRRSDGPTRDAYSQEFSALIDIIASHLDADEPTSARIRTFAAVASMIGVMQLARTMTDPELSNDLLEQGIQNALVLFGVA